MHCARQHGLSGCRAGCHRCTIHIGAIIVRQTGGAQRAGLTAIVNRAGMIHPVTAVCRRFRHAGRRAGRAGMSRRGHQDQACSQQRGQAVHQPARDRVRFSPGCPHSLQFPAVSNASVKDSTRLRANSLTPAALATASTALPDVAQKGAVPASWPPGDRQPSKSGIDPGHGSRTAGFAAPTASLHRTRKNGGPVRRKRTSLGNWCMSPFFPKRTGFSFSAGDGAIEKMLFWLAVVAYAWLGVRLLVGL